MSVQRKYEIEVTPEAEKDMEWLSARDRATLFEALGRRLPHEPTVENRNRKRLRPNPIAPWELRVGRLRVYFDVAESPRRVVTIQAVGVKDRNRLDSRRGGGAEMKSVKLSQVTGSLSDFARDGLQEPVVVTRQGRPLVAVMPLGRYDDRESVALSTNPKFLEIIERSRASAREKGTVPLAEVRKRLAPKRKPARRGKRQR